MRIDSPSSVEGGVSLESGDNGVCGLRFFTFLAFDDEISHSVNSSVMVLAADDSNSRADYGLFFGLGLRAGFNVWNL